MAEFYNRISAMEPLLPPEPLPPSLETLAVEVIRDSAKLGASLPPATREALAELFREMNSYYSNLIEGHKTNPFDIQQALQHNFSKEPAKHALQLESLAHIEVQKLIEKKLKSEPNIKICSPEFLGWIHQAFCSRLPEEFKIIEGKEKNIILEPGVLRTREVIVGHHVPPISTSLPQFLERFAKVYEPSHYSPIMRVIAAAASHHRLAWIHPFLDGNGRVVRLFSDTYFVKANIEGHGLWTISRGLARNRNRYMAALESADAPRQGDLDGRGNLSLKGLLQFCEFFLEIALDQIRFVTSLLDVEALPRRIENYVSYLASENKLKSESSYLLKAAFLQGEIARGEMGRITGMSDRSARNLLKPLLERGLLKSATPKGPLRLGFPIDAVQYYFPLLYPDT